MAASGGGLDARGLSYGCGVFYKSRAEIAVQEAWGEARMVAGWDVPIRRTVAAGSQPWRPLNVGKNKSLFFC